MLVSSPDSLNTTFIVLYTYFSPTRIPTRPQTPCEFDLFNVHLEQVCCLASKKGWTELLSFILSTGGKKETPVRSSLGGELERGYLVSWTSQGTSVQEASPRADKQGYFLSLSLCQATRILLSTSLSRLISLLFFPHSEVLSIQELREIN